MPKLTREETQTLFRALEISSLSEIDDDWVGQFLSKLNDPVKKAAWNQLLGIIEEFRPEEYKRLNNFAKNNKGMLLEFQGWERWLKTLGAQTFTRDFAPIQKRFWDWNWRALLKIRKNVPLDPKEMVGFLPWSRETGKSSVTEWACIAEGALLRGGYVIFYSGKQSQAEEHVTSIRDRIESEHVSDLYPWLGKPKVGAHGNKFGWGKEFLMTSGGWAIRPVGADVAIRGGKTLNLRPTLIVVDDLDELGESPVVVEHKEQILTRSILPMGNDKTRVLVPQNPIHANSVVNRMLTGVSLALAIRTVFGELNDDGSMSTRPVPAVRDFAYEVRQTDEGPFSKITQGETNWPGITIEGWERTLNRVGPLAFESEYQHRLDVMLEERVLPEYDDRVLRTNLISWSQYETMYGTRRIPSDWICDVGCDIGYSVGHRTAFTFLTRAPHGAPLAGSIFRYRGCVFTATTIGEMSTSVKARLWPDENLQREWLSHEKLGERLVLNREHGWHFQTCESAKTAGIPQWRHFLKSDKTQPHPFHRDEKSVDGLWKIGRPAWFDVVDDDQFFQPYDDRGLKVHRDQAFNWRLKPEKLTESGLTIQQPMKADEDSCDATRMCTAAPNFGPTMRGMTQYEKVQAIIPQGYHVNELVKRVDLDPNQQHMTGQMATFLARKTLGLDKPKLVDPWGQPIR